MKKYIGVSLFAAALLTVNSVSVVSAVENKSIKSQGVGVFEGNVSTNVFKIDLPTLSETEETTLGFILDPNNLITKTNAAKYKSEGATFSGGKGFYFKNADGNYTNVSDDITAINKSTRDVNVSVEAELTECGSIALAGSEAEFAGQSGPGICVTLNDVAGNTEAIQSGAPAVIDSKIEKASSSAFLLSYDEEEGYVYSEAPMVGANDFKSYSFHLEGAANTQGNWGTVPADISPKLNLVWNFEESLGNVEPYIEGISVLNFSTKDPVSMKINLGSEEYAATDFTIEVSGTSSSIVNGVWLWPTSSYTEFNDGVITIGPDFAVGASKMGVTGGILDITFNNAKSDAGDQCTVVHLPFTIS